MAHLLKYLNGKYCDVHVSCGDDKVLHTTKASVCEYEYFRTLIAKFGDKHVEMKSTFASSVMLVILMYMDGIDIDGKLTTPDEFLPVMIASNMYLIDELFEKCCKIILRCGLNKITTPDAIRLIFQYIIKYEKHPEKQKIAAGLITRCKDLKIDRSLKSYPVHFALYHSDSSMFRRWCVDNADDKAFMATSLNEVDESRLDKRIVDLFTMTKRLCAQ